MGIEGEPSIIQRFEWASLRRQASGFITCPRTADSMEKVCLKFSFVSLYILKNKLKKAAERCPPVDFLVFERKLLSFLLICQNETKLKSEHSQ